MKLVALALLAVHAWSQGGAPARPEFEVISVKRRAEAGERRWQFNRCAGGRLVASNIAMRMLIEWAYDIHHEFEVPEWAGFNAETYDVEALAAGPASIAECRLMTQRLLETRFQLQMHRESRETRVYALVRAKSALGLKPANIEHPSEADGIWLQGQKIGARGWEPWMLASWLESQGGVDLPVVDRTGLKGLFQFRLDYSSEPGNDRPDIFLALTQQLGLRLEIAKAPVDFVVIDRLERPLPN